MKKIIVTTSWDDGHLMDLKLAKLLNDHGIKGTFYVSPRNREFETNDLLSDDQILQIGRDFEIGGHTFTHPRLGKVSMIEASNEITQCKQYLERLLKKPVTSFCYPGGDYTQLHIELLKNAGFSLARTVVRFSKQIGDNLFELPTTIHVFNHRSDVWRIICFAKFNPFKFIQYYLNWNILAKALFDDVCQSGGVFHLWGHSWEIEKNKQWQQLEDVLMHISNKKEVHYVTNGSLI